MSNELRKRLKNILQGIPPYPGIPLVVLSGGFDSALLVHTLAEMHVQFNVVHVSSQNVRPTKRERELEAYNYIVDTYSNNIVKHYIYEMPGLNVQHGCTVRYILPWAHATAAALITTENVSCVLTGQLLTDENKVDGAFEKIYHGALDSFQPQLWDGKSKPKHIMPLHNFTKCEVLAMVDLKLAQHLTFCESGLDGDNCGTCAPCNTFYSALLRKNVEASKRLRLLQQSNRTEGMLRYLAELHRLGDDTLHSLGLHDSSKNWDQISNDYLVAKYQRENDSPKNVGLLGVADVILKSAPEDSALGEDVCMLPSV